MPTEKLPGLFPVGRLDADTTGLLLFTTDGMLGQHLLHPSHHVDKTYIANVKGVPSDDELSRLRQGIELDDGMTSPAVVKLIEVFDADSSVLSITIHEGRKHQVKRMCEAIGHEVVALHRQTFGPLSLGDEPEGSWRELTGEELAMLRQAAGLKEGDEA